MVARSSGGSFALRAVLSSRCSSTNQPERVMSMTLAIETHKLTRYFNDFCAVNGIELAVERGTFYGFLGPNGAGKSTTIKMLTGTARPFRRADDRAGTEHARSARVAGGQAPHGGHSGGPGAVRQPDGARVSHVRRPHPSDAARHDPQPDATSCSRSWTFRTRRRSSRWNTRTA